MSLTKLLLVIVGVSVLGTIPVETLAQTASARGMGQVNWSGWRLNSEERQEALQLAKRSAVEAYLAETSSARMRLFAARRDELSETIDRYVLSAQVLNESSNKKSKSYEIVIRAEINAALLQADLDAGSATAKLSALDRSLIAALFMSRMQASAQSFDDRVYKRADVSASSEQSKDYAESITEGERITSNQVELAGSSRSQEQRDAKLTVTSEEGGSVTRKAEVVTWQVGNSNEVNARMSSVFGAAGYELVEAEYVEPESGGHLRVDRVRKDFSTGDDLSSEVMRATVNGVKYAGISLLAIGTLDVGIRDTDPVSGNTRVFVTVTGRVLDVSGRFPKTVSSVGPIQFAGLGPNETVARTNALSLAAENAAKVLVDEMNLRGVR